MSANMNESSPTPCFEEALAELESIVGELEEGELGLAAALARYEQGVKHLRRCYALLENAQQKIELLTGVREDGTAVAEPFVEGCEENLETKGRARSKRRSQSPSTSATRGEEGGDSQLF